jgi:hypothetical protein
LLIFLSCRYASKDEFAQQGFVREVRARRIAADVLLVDAHTGYFDNLSVLDRLEADVFAPARALPPLILGDGGENWFAHSHHLLAVALPPERVFTTPGGHNWPEWCSSGNKPWPRSPCQNATKGALLHKPGMPDGGHS